MTAAIRLGWRLLRRGGRTDWLALALGVIAVAVSATLLLLTLGVNHGLDERGERSAWRHPVPATATATAVQAVTTDFVAGTPIVVVDLARLTPAAPPPPGMPRMPEPGEVWVSPALLNLVRSSPQDQLAERLLPASGRPTGVLGADALVHPDELVAVVGRTVDDPVLTSPRQPDPRRDGDVVPATPIDHYSTALVDFSPAALYVGLGRVAAVLVIVPLLVLGGAAARLSVTRRDQRLAALRLAGATPRQVVTVTTVEAVATGAVGVVLAVLAYLSLLPVAALVRVGGGAFLPGQLWVGWPVLVAVVVGVPLLVGGSAVLGLTRVIVSPLGVAHRHTPARLKVARLAVFGLVMFLYARVTTSADVALGSVLVVLAGAFAALAVVGPWVLGVLGRITAARARGPVLLLAGRRLADDPRSAWRTVSGLTLAAFIAGFLAPYSSSDAASVWGPPDQLILAAPQAAAIDDVVQEARADLAAAGLDAGVGIGTDPFLGPEPDRRVLLIDLPGADADTVDRARTALHGLVPGQPAVTGGDIDWQDRQFSADYRTIGMLVLAAAFAVAAASATITSAASVLDQRTTIAQLRLAGFPLSRLQQAHLAQTAVPLLVTAGGALVVGLACAAPYTLLSGGPIDVRGLAVLVVCVVTGTGATLGAAALTRPLLRALAKRADVAPAGV